MVLKAVMKVEVNVVVAKLWAIIRIMLVVMVVRLSDGQTDNGDCRVAFPMEYFV